MRLFLISCLVVAFYAAGAQRQIAVEDFTVRNTFGQKSVYGINWMKNGQFYSSLQNNKVVKYSITTGQPVETIVDGAGLSPALQIDDYSLSADETKVLLLTDVESIYRHSFTAQYFVYDIAQKTVKPLSGNGKQSYAAFSPDGSKVAFVRGNNVFYVTLADMQEVQVTTDGKFNHIINGTTDWVYEEEFSFVDGFQWSPDSKKLAYYRFDESGVREYNLQRWGKTLYPTDYRFKYPKAGEANSIVEIWLYDVASKQKVKADIGTETDIYIPRIKWTHDAQLLSVRRLNRLQNSLDVLHVNAATGASRVVLNEKSDTYVDLDFIDNLLYLDNGTQFIHASERSGYKHLYLYDMNGKLVRQLTQGNFEIADVVGVDEKGKTLYFTSTEVSPRERYFYSLSFDGKKKTRLTAAPGTHRINMSSDYQFYIDYYSQSAKPLVVSLYKTKGNALLKVLENNETLAKAQEEYGFANKEFFSFKAADGTTTLDGFFLKPRNFDASKKYPVLVYQYSGPGSQEVTDSWGGRHFIFHQILTQKGYVVAVIDPRGTGARGEHFKKINYKQLGKYELEDHLAGAKYLASLPYIDPARIGIWGWSFGGYISSLAMTKGAGVFKMGIAVAPVTNWRFYDNIYTERFQQTPQMNASGYDDNSPSTYAGNLKGNFLLIHGTGDDNVHFQNSVVLEAALINAGKKFRSFYYPDKDHHILGGPTRLHLYTMMCDYVLESL
ncbi:S9 family peptidase [Dawidia soli]|uniref:DPP IV N-terminal domain-containing protein n=1 Tax=Dawidia soli TaxID=2782352 RepID=A0AAP2GFP9_9BACT|nr:DPP IV N-terminal domain-containing protein [Dawidia soli]MBT1685326.1 DPP IV N-terminal domain-containing protein [Dawidia soli]